MGGGEWVRRWRWRGPLRSNWEAIFRFVLGLCHRYTDVCPLSLLFLNFILAEVSYTDSAVPVNSPAE